MTHGEMLEGEFLRELRRIKGWMVNDGVLRTASWPCACPVAAVANRVLGSHFDSEDWKLAAWAVGLPESFAVKVVQAADGVADADPKLKAKLLEACGVKP